jgi:hypothetical protein
VSDLRRWEHPALTEARRAFKGRRGKPTEADRPPPPLFPMTPAARAAKEMRERQGRIEP